MKASEQDRHYLDVEADSFFERNFGDTDPAVLRPSKVRIAEALASARVRPRRVLEYGCNYGDLLDHYARTMRAECVGVEPSAQAVAFGTRAYGERIELLQGTIADNPIAEDPRFHQNFDLVIVDDVFCWVSRETLFQSVAHVDDALADGGFLYIREFAPLHNERNRNHHVSGADVYCYKPAGLHAAMFTASGIYAVVWQQISVDPQDAWIRENGRDPFGSRWSETILRKSYGDYFETGSR